MAQSAREYDINGWFEVSDNPISKEGIYQYSGGQVGHVDKGRIFNVYRPAEELSRPETLESFRLVPIIDGHEMLGDGQKPADEYGVGGVVGENVKFKDGVMTANLKIFGKGLADKIKSGKTELSLGYRCVYEFTRGEWKGQPFDAIQRSIRGNHLAFVDEGRMGKEVSILDHMVFTVDAKEQSAMDEEMRKAIAAMMEKLESLSGRIDAIEGAEKKPEVTVKAGEDAGMAEDEEKVEVVEDEEKIVAEVEDDDTVTVETPAMDALLKTVNKLAKRVDTLASRPAMDEALLATTLAKKSALVEDLKPYIGVFDHASMTFDQVAAYGVEKLGITDVAKGAEAVAIKAYIQGKAAPVVHAMDSKAPSKLGDSIKAYASGAKA